MNELIEKLKNNEKIFRYNTGDEQQIFEKVGRENCFCIDGIEYNPNQLKGVPFDQYKCYAIKPDYQPKPEYKDVPIKEEGRFLGIFQNDTDIKLAWHFVHLHCIPSMPNFVEFCVDNGEGMKICKISTESIPGHISSGKTVIARFRV